MVAVVLGETDRVGVLLGVLVGEDPDDEQADSTARPATAAAMVRRVMTTVLYGARSETVIASTASSGATLASIASRAARTASIRRSVVSGSDSAASPRNGRFEIGVDEVDRCAELDHEHVAIERREVDQRTVEHVALRAGRP